MRPVSRELEGVVRTHISSPSLKTVPIPHSTAYLLSSLISLATIKLRFFPSTASGSPWVILIVHRPLWKIGLDVECGSASCFDFLRLAPPRFLALLPVLVRLSVLGKYGSGGTTTLTPSPNGSGSTSASISPINNSSATGTINAFCSVFLSVRGSKPNPSSLHSSSSSSVSSPPNSDSESGSSVNAVFGRTAGVRRTLSVSDSSRGTGAGELSRERKRRRLNGDWLRARLRLRSESLSLVDATELE